MSSSASNTITIKPQRIVVAALVLVAANVFAEESTLERGRYLLHAGGCITCHTEDADGAIPLAGGRALESPFGTFYTPNITPDVETGIGSWSDDDFVNAFWDGISPDGEHYYPAFPFTAYTGIQRDDLLALKAYLFSLKTVPKIVPDHQLAWYMSTRLAAQAWKRRFFEPARFAPDTRRSKEWNRGAYLVRHLGHCGECHTPRNKLGVLLADQELAGSVLGEEKVPNITPYRKDGIGKWSVGDIEYFLDIGMLPDGDFAGGAMSDVIDDSTANLTQADRLAIAAYLKSLPERELPAEEAR